MQLFLHCLQSPPGMASGPPPRLTCCSGRHGPVRGQAGDDSTNGEAGRGTSNDDMEDGGSEPEPHFPARTQ